MANWGALLKGLGQGALTLLKNPKVQKGLINAVSALVPASGGAYKVKTDSNGQQQLVPSKAPSMVQSLATALTGPRKRSVRRRKRYY